MPGKLDIYNLGELGVDVVKSPIHQADGDLIQAQNAMPDPAGLEGGIRKRDGMARVNAVALTGAIEGILNVPLPLPGSRRYYAAEAGLWWSSVGGALGSWATSTTPSTPADPGQASSSSGAGLVKAVSFRRRLFFPQGMAAGTAARIRVWDGVTNNILCRLPNRPGSAFKTCRVQFLWVHRGFLYAIGGSNDEPLFDQVYRANIVTGAVERIGNATTYLTQAILYFGLNYQDRLWFGGSAGGSLGVLKWLRNGEENPTIERTSAAGQISYRSAAVFRGKLYVGTMAADATNAIIEVRHATTGVWTTSDTGASAAGTGFNEFTNLVVWNDALYCVYRVVTDLASILRIRKFDGTTWTTDYDMIATGGLANALPKSSLSENTALYLTFGDSGYVMRKTGVTWQRVATIAGNGGALGFIGFIP